MSVPNFVLIMTDTQATNVLGAYGHPEMKTPHIDNLAKTGMVFERAYTCCPICSPARAAIFTGIYPHNSGPWANDLPVGNNIMNMGQRFQAGGYHTVYIGKWHLSGHDYFDSGICPPGWDDEYWYDGARYLSELTDEEKMLWRQGLKSVDDLRNQRIQPDFTWAHRSTDRAIKFLQKRREEPFLLVISYDEPHHPWTCPAEFAEKFEDFSYDPGPAGEDALTNKPAHQQEWSAASSWPDHKKRNELSLYFGCNAYVDAEIGRIIDAVHLYSPQDTFIIFTSDHGELLGSHQLTGKGACMYEEITHIPLIIEQPGQKRSGQRCSSLVSHIDLLPTMLELAGLANPPILDGNSLVPLLAGCEQSERSIALEFNRYEAESDSFGGFLPIRCWMKDHYKLVINLLSTDELYDLLVDPYEMDNLIEKPQVSKVRDELHDELLNWMNEKRDPFRGYIWERRPWRSDYSMKWKGPYHHRPADGFAPPILSYGTGLPVEGK